MNKYKVDINLVFLKLIAIISMTIDHMYKVGLIEQNDFTVITGRLAFPIFVFLLANGIKNTSSIKSYRNRLLIFSLISILPYSMYTYLSQGKILSHLNILFTLFTCVYLIEMIRARNVLGIFTSCLINFISDYPVLSIILALSFYYLFINETIKNIYVKILSVLLYTLVAYLFYGNVQLWSLLSFIIIFIFWKVIPSMCVMVKLHVKKVIQYAFYIYYPLHLLIIVLFAITTHINKGM